MPTCRQRDAEADLGDLLPDFRLAMRESVKWFWENHDGDAHWMEHRTQANIIRDRAANVELPNLILGKPKIKDIEHNQIKLFVIERGRRVYSIKVKQMDEMGGVSSGKTQLSFDYNENAQLDIPGIPSRAIALHLGAVPNIARRDDPEILLACADGDEPAWVIRLSDLEPPPVVEIAPMPLPNTGTRRVRVKRTGRDKSSQ